MAKPKRKTLPLLQLLFVPAVLLAQFHRAEQDREISYWLLDPATHQFRFFMISPSPDPDRNTRTALSARAA